MEHVHGVIVGSEDRVFRQRDIAGDAKAEESCQHHTALIDYVRRQAQAGVGEVAKHVHFPVLSPRLPGTFYCCDTTTKTTTTTTTTTTNKAD